MKVALVTFAVFLALLAPFFLLLAALRFISRRRRQGTAGVKLVPKGRSSPMLTFLFELLGGLF